METYFSIIVPAYNVEVYIRRCLESILQQCCPFYEVILVDDGSTDQTGTICDVYAKQYPQFNCIHQENRGLAAARNTGLAHAKGNYIAFLDADDWVEKEWLQKALCAFRDKKADLVSYAARRVNTQLEVLYDMRFEDAIGEWSLNDGNRGAFLLTHFLQYQLGWEVCFHIYRADIINQYNIRFNEKTKYAEDLMFSFSYMMYVNKYVKLPDVLYNYLSNQLSLTGATPNEQKLKYLFGDNYLDMKVAVQQNQQRLSGIIPVELWIAFCKYFLYESKIEEKELLYLHKENLLDTNICKNAVKNPKIFVRLFGKQEGKLYYDWYKRCCRFIIDKR